MLFTSPGRLPEHALQPDMVSFNTLMAITAEQQPNLAIELLGEMYVGGPWSWVWACVWDCFSWRGLRWKIENCWKRELSKCLKIWFIAMEADWRRTSIFPIENGEYSSQRFVSLPEGNYTDLFVIVCVLCVCYWSISDLAAAFFSPTILSTSPRENHGVLLCFAWFHCRCCLVQSFNPAIGFM